MKPFKSFLSSLFQDYCIYRKGLGYTDTNLWLSLSYLDRYLQNKEGGWDLLTPSFFLHFRASLKLNPRTVNEIMSTVCSFFSYMQRIEYIKENPVSNIPPLKEYHFIPFVFSEEEIEQLLFAVQKQIKKNEKYFLYDLARYVALVLLARCGMRISEPTRLLINHYYPQEATLYIEKTKFKKDRLIPIPAKVVTEIENYLAVRKSLLGRDNNPSLLAAGEEKSLSRAQLYPLFHQAVKENGLMRTRKRYADTIFGGPTPHSLRHSFAINTLTRIRKQGKSPQNALPVLAAYMGHCHYQDTAVYLKVLNAQQAMDLYTFAREKW